MKLGAANNVAEFDREFVAWMKRFRKSLPKALREEGKQIAKFLALPPSGVQPATPPGTRKQGEGAVKRDVARVFGVLTPRSIRLNFTNEHVRNRLLKLVAARDYKGLAEVWQRINPNGPLVSIFTPGAVERERDVRGRVRRKKARWITMDEQAVKDYIAKKMRNVGMARGGWAPFLESQGGKVPEWIGRHRYQGSFVDAADASKNPSISMTNRSPWAGYRSEAERIVNNALRNRAVALREKVKAAIKYGNRAKKEAA